MAKHLLVTIILGMLLVVGSVGCKKDNADPSFEVSDLPEEGDVANGQQIFEQGSGGAAACSTCHSIDGVDGSAGPTLANFNERA